MSEPKRTPLHSTHVDAGARMVRFGGWSLPVAYASQIDEHNAVRRAAGMFDVSHMTIVDISGTGAQDYLRRLLANDVAKLATPEGAARALYTCLLNDDGGILDDLIVYRLGESSFRLVLNAGTREKDLAWLEDHACGRAVVIVERSDLAMVAVQGPRAREIVSACLGNGAATASMAPFTALWNGEWLVARTGYTGEDGVEIMLPAGRAPGLWAELRSHGVAQCGLGARDTLRLEAGMNLYGLDMDESVSPLECGLGWTVDFGPERDFLGRGALEAQRRAGAAWKRAGLILEGRGIARTGFAVETGAGQGKVTSGTFSPTLGRAIALARVPSAAEGPCEVLIRGRLCNARSVEPPFVRNGRITIALDNTGNRGAPK